MSVAPLLPPDYRPYQNFVICGNTFNNGLVPFSVNGEFPFLVGKGPEPLIWLNLFTDTGSRPLMRAGQKLHDDVTTERVEKSLWRVLVRSETIIEFLVKGDESVEVTKLDLRPLGLAVFGNKLGLHVGGMQLSNNTFNNVKTMIALGGRETAEHLKK